LAGDWIKVRKGLHTHPKVVRIASALNADRCRVVGALHAVWGVFDEHSIDGHLPGYSFATMDEIVGWHGFCEAMSGVGWLDRDGDCGLKMPDFSEHNGASAKRRAQEAERKRQERNSVLDLSASDADTLRTREEKRREEKNNTSAGFARFWLTWPASSRKVAKSQCERRWIANRLEAEADRIVAHVEAMKSHRDWLKDQGEFIPAPMTYLNQRRWEQEAPIDADEFARSI
jgi:hypothetical protein